MNVKPAALSSIAALDLRSLALFRIGLGLTVAVDAIWRLVDVEVFLTDSGMRPRGNDALAELLKGPSLYLLNGSIPFASALLAFAVLAGLALAVGFRTRIAAIACWVLVVSVQNRNPAVTSGADSVLAMMCLLACFLPLDARFSVDRARIGAENTPAGQLASTWATLALVVQLVIIYAFNVINKLPGASWRNGRAVQDALHIDQHTTPIGVFVLDHLRFLCMPMTYGTLLVEACAFLLLVPVTAKLITQQRRDRLRLGLVIAMWLLHIGFGVCLYLMLFSPVCMVAWSALLPSSVWQRSSSPQLAPGAAPEPRTSPWAAALLAVLMLAQLFSNTAVSVHGSSPINRITQPLHISPTWKMFSPNPGLNAGWFVIPATLANGDVVDLFPPDAPPVSLARPRYVSHLYKNGHWRQFLMGHSVDKDDRGLKPWARWLCRDWNRSHDEEHHLDKLTIAFMLEKTRADNKPAIPERHDIVVDYACPVEREQ
jgi:hypothetical protein